MSWLGEISTDFVEKLLKQTKNDLNIGEQTGDF